MSKTSRPVRLNKAAKEFNVGISTIVEFLNSEGVEIDSKPTTKLDPEVYDLVVGKFQTDQQVKEKASEIRRKKRVEKESLVIESRQKKEEPKPEPAIENKPKVVEKPVAPVEEPVAETPPVTPVKPAEPTVEEKEKTEEKEESKIAEKPKEEEAVNEDKSTEDSKENGGLKVLGHVDLAGLKKPKKKTPKDKTKETPKAEEKVEEKPAQASKKVIEDQKPEKQSVITAKAEKLSGTTVLGKIVLPETKKKKPVASSSGSTAGNKQKRKRKRVPGKVNVQNQSGNQNRRNKQRGGKKAEKKPELTAKEIQKEIKDTLARLNTSKKNKGAKNRRDKRKAVAQKTEEELQRLAEESKILKLTEFVTVSELASMMDVSATEIIAACMSLGIFASINQRLDAETITIIVEEFGYGVEFISVDLQDEIEEIEDKEEDLVARPPIVTVMGHVDHGKTSLLDYIRKENVIAGEAGGITQHIGAYNVQLDDGQAITFLDTPGHEAFTAMRARGAQVTDIAIIVVAADDAVMPQTKEAINHAQAAGIPIVFAINKIDRPEANPDKIKEELSQMNILVEDWGGKYQSQEISAKKGTNIDELLEKVLLEAEMLDLKANPNKKGVGTVLESTLDKGRGYVITAIIEGGTIKVGDPVIAGQCSGKIKALHDERGNKVKSVGPGMPASILGMDGAPKAGDKLHVMDDEREARSIATRRQQLQREQTVRAQKHITMAEIARRIALGEFNELNLIVKGDVDGSVEALADSLQKLSTDTVHVNVIHKAVGQIAESDVLLASASDAIIVGFQVRPSAIARKLAEKEGVEIKLYSVIYAAIDDIRDAMEGLLSLKIEEKVVGTAEIRNTFKISKVGTIAGCFVTDGKIYRNNKVRLIRDGIVIYQGELGSLKRFKDDVKDVSKGYECGLNIAKYNDIKVGDIIEAYEEVEVKQKLN